MVHTSSLKLIGATLLLATISIVLAHGHDDHPSEMADTGSVPSSLSIATINSSSVSPQSYFTYPGLNGLMLGHIVLMTVAWFFILPISKHISQCQHSFPC